LVYLNTNQRGTIMY